ncbi:MAG TPA: recombinase family protein [Gemmataceae bacterium]|jgi:DNA invertase Pin-like site-specific DNA recombinase
MSDHHSTSEKEAVRAGIYARKSTTRQEDSIERQLSSVLPYCEKKEYLIVGEPYVDEGIAGDVFDKRPAFQRLLKDAKAGLFDVIVCDEWSRLSRQEPVKFISTVVDPLKDADVTLDCVAEGVQRWDDLAQLILMTVRADKSQGESKTRSYRTLTGMAEHARRRAILGPAPYGYLTEYETIQEPGKPPRIVPARFIPDPRKAHVVRWIFEKYVQGGWSMYDLARELNARAVEPPAGKGGRASKTRQRGQPCQHWTTSSIRAILKNPRYTGALTWNRRSRGKYHRLADGQAKAVSKVSDRPNEQEEWIVSSEPPHEALCTQEQFDRAQERMLANKGRKVSTDPYLFAGLVTCSHCGRTLTGLTVKNKRRYRCHKFDSSGNVVCGNNAVDESWLLDRVLRVLEEEMLAPNRLTTLREEVRRQDEEERAPVVIEPLQQRLADLKARIAQGNENLAILPQDRVPGVVAVVRAWEQERDQIEAELKRRQGGGNLEGLDEAIAVCETLLWRLREAVASCDPLLLREVFREAVVRIELTWEKRPGRKHTRYILQGGVIHLRPQAGEKYLTLHAKPCSAHNNFACPSPCTAGSGSVST